MSQTMKERATEVIMPLYPAKDVTLERGEGVYLYDDTGKEYLDCAAGIAVSSLGHGNTAYTQGAIDQLNKFIMCVGSFPTKPKVEAAELLVSNCCAEQIFFCNSGAEAIEGSLKLARKWAHKNKSENCKDIIAFDQSFHGRTYGAVSCTYKSTKQPEFGPYLPGVHFAEFNNLESVKSLINDNVCAILVEPIQGEGGIRPATKEFMQGLRALCDEHEIVLISDEIQAGMGRLGTLFAHDYFDIEVDLCTIAKGMGGGFPIGAFLGKKKFTSAFDAGDHGTTYGGNPLGTRLVYETVKQINQPEFLKNVKETGTYLLEQLEKLKGETNSIEEIRGIGLMIGVDTAFDIKEILNELLHNGLIATQAGANSLRLTPPLIFDKSHVDEAIDKIGHVIKKSEVK
ncbi:MAG: acetylornithine/succinylornithine family transaminase [Pseudomonadota bacterium]